MRCACGRDVTVPTAEAPRDGGPYRRAASVAATEQIGTTRPFPCPYCGNECPPLVRICPHCDVRLESVRCVQCFHLHAPGSFACGSCGKAMELEPVLDATDAPCPRCTKPLEASGDGLFHECPHCGGLFLGTEQLADILGRAEVAGPFPTEPRQRPVATLGDVRYVPCPLCHATMNRVNFGKVSGVIVDVCRAHGTWFDAGELTRVLTFVASGGLEKTRAREEREKRETARTLYAMHKAAMVDESRYNAEQRAREWREFLSVLFS